MTIASQRFDKHRLKAGIVEPECKSVDNQRLASTPFHCNRYFGKIQSVVTGLTEIFTVKDKTE
jgi:hypothetical protein